MESDTTNPMEFVEALGLQPEANGLFVGKVQGFPVGVKVITSEIAAVLLVQVRHWLIAPALAATSLCYDSLVTRLLAEKTVEIEMEDRLAWVTITDPDKCLSAAPVSQVLVSVLTAFAQAGLIGDPSLCHYCQKEKVPTLTISDGKVAQICEPCLSARKGGPRAERLTAGAESVWVGLLTPVAALVGAGLWAGSWMSYDLLMSGVGGGRVYFPRIVLVIAMVIVGLMVGGPVGWILKQNRGRGPRNSATTAILYTSAAVVAGELLYIAWYIHQEFGVFSLSTALRVMPAFYRDCGGFYLGMKAVAVVVGLIFAFEMAKPQKAGLKL